MYPPMHAGADARIALETAAVAPATLYTVRDWNWCSLAAAKGVARGRAWVP